MNNIEQDNSTKKGRKFTAVLTVILLSVLFAPGVAQLIGVKDVAVNGIALPSSRPVFSISAIAHEKFQKGCEAWALKKNGLWSRFVRAANQIYFTAFGQISSGYNQSIIVGSDHRLFQPMYLSSFNRNKEPPAKLIENRIKDVARLQDILAKQGKFLLVILSPNAIALYPEMVPADFSDPSREARKNSYALARPLLDKYGVNYIDFFEYFGKKKEVLPYKIFEPTGSHWNNPASCDATSKVMERIAAGLGKPLPSIECGPVHYQFPPPAKDTDLVEIANLLFEKSVWQQAPVSKITPHNGPDSCLPRMLFVGTSFLFALTDHIYEQKMADQSNLWFYYREQKHLGQSTFHPLTKKGLILSEYLKDTDVVVLEVNQASPGALGFGFIEDALRSYKQKEKKETTAKKKEKRRTTARQLKG